jgi:hypothetical protein
MGSGIAGFRQRTGEYDMVSKMLPKDVRNIEKTSAHKDLHFVDTATGQPTEPTKKMKDEIKQSGLTLRL